jgi:hypothetical protein
MDVATVKTLSKHRKFSEFYENPESCSDLGFYIYNTHVQFWKQKSFRYTGSLDKKKLTTKIEDSGTLFFASRQGRFAMLTVPSSLHFLIRSLIVVLRPVEDI